MTELLVPEKLDTLQLAAAAKAVAAGSVFGSAIKITVGPTEFVTLVVDDGARIVEPNAMVRYLSETSGQFDILIDFEEQSVYPLVKSVKPIDAETAAKLGPLLPQSLTPAAVILFGSLYALVSARSKTALAVDAPTLMWYQQQLNTPRVKNALASLSKLPYDKPATNRASSRVPSQVLPKPAAKDVPKEGKEATKEAAKEVKEAPPKPERTGAKKVNQKVALVKPEGKILPKEGEDNYLVTSALPYVNNVPHLGNIIGSVLSADFFARYCKGRGYNTLFICGTDEYGTATETKAIEENVTPLELCTKYHKIHKEVYDWFDIGFDHFGRTSTPEQTKISQQIFTECYENGYLEEHEQEQLYCTKHKGFLADRFVEGTCPKCNYDDARGDQCDSCGQLLDPMQLINPRCKLDGTTPESRVTKHMYLSLQKLQPKLEKWIEGNDTEKRWSKNSRVITQSWLRDGLLPRAITRDLKWGVPVPLEGYEDKVLYVWFDAPIGYPSITATYTEDWELWWKNPENVRLFQFMGKDNVPFHSVIFPSCEIASGEKWTMLSNLSTTEYLQYEGGKFSKSRNLGVFGNNAKDIGIPASVWRYYLASARPETSDSQFSWADFVARNNSELLANLGNLVNRVVKFSNAKYNGVVAEFNPQDLSDYNVFVADVNDLLSKYNTAMATQQLREGLELGMRISSRGNQFLQENKLDNTLFSEHPAQCAAVIGVALNLIYILSAVMSPFIPTACESMVQQLEAPLRKIPDEFDLAIEGGHNIGKAQYLFSRIDDKMIDEWKAKYGSGSGANDEAKDKKKKNKKKKSSAKEPAKEPSKKSAN